MTLSPEQFIGAWSLRDWRIEYSDGRVTHPFGKNAVGQILYSADGQMSATVSATDREALKSENIRKANTNELSAAFSSYFHYAGYWRIDDDQVIHTVSLALNPAFVGSEQRRKVHFKENCLQLSAHEDIGNGDTRYHILEWEKRNSE